MNNNGMSVFACGLIWFGAAISAAEIEAGIQSGTNWLALVLGHALGGAILFAVGLIGAFSRLNAMETTSETFGKYGSKFFATLNMFQLVGWTSVMLAQASLILKGINNSVPEPVAIAILAAFIALGILVGIKNAAKVAAVGMVLLSILFAILAYKLLTVHGSAGGAPVQPLSFWEAFEVSVAMPLSWLPLISDYTKNARRPVAGTATSAIVYTIVSICMFGIGMLISKWGEGANLAFVIKAVGLGLPGFIIVGFSTIATTFLDAYSAGESARTIYGKVPQKAIGVITCTVGAFLAISGIIDKYTNFLYLIASVFAPMAIVLLVSHYLAHNRWKWNFVAWAAGFTIYQLASTSVIHSPVGPSIAAILTSAAFAFAGKAIR